MVSDAERILARLAPDFGFTEPGKDEDPTRYKTRYGNVVLAQLSAERRASPLSESECPSAP